MAPKVSPGQPRAHRPWRAGVIPLSFAAMKRFAVCALMAMLSVGGAARAQDLTRSANEGDEAFARRALHLTAEQAPHVVAAPWNGVPTLFVDYPVDKGGEMDRPLAALMRQADGRYRLVQVTVGEEEGDTATFEGLGFADADHSGTKSLIAILSWSQRHGDLVNGTLYEVRIFAPPRPGQTALTPSKVSSHFGDGCECEHNDGGPKDKPYETHFRFKTVAAVKSELKRMGF
jgi:hypothetical protein